MKEEEHEYIQVRRDLFDKYGFSTSLVIQVLMKYKDGFLGTMHDFSDKVEYLTYEATRHIVNRLLNSGAIGQIKISPTVYRIILYDTDKVKKPYEREKFVTKNKDVRRLVEQIKKDREKKARKNLK